MRIVPLFVIGLFFAAAPAFAGGLARAYIPSKASGRIQAMQNVFQSLPEGSKNSPRGLAMLPLDARALIPMVMVMTPAQQVKLESAVDAKDFSAVGDILNLLDARARVYASQEAARLLKDQVEGKIADAQLDDAKTFASEFLVTFGAYLDSDVKTSVFKAAAKLEQRRLAAEEHKEMALAQVMRDMSVALTDERSKPAVEDTVGGRAALPLKTVTVDPYNATLEKFGRQLIRAAAEKDEADFRKWLGASYETLAVEIKPALDRIAAGQYGLRERDEVMELRANVYTFHWDMENKMNAAGIPGAAKVVSVKSLGMRDGLVWDSVLDINDAGRDAVLGAIAKAEAKSRARTPDIEKLMPAASFLAVETLASSDDGSVIPHLKKILKFYDKSLANAGEGSYRKEVEQKLATGFDGKVPTVQRVWEIWTAAMEKEGNRAALVNVRDWWVVGLVVSGALSLAGLLFSAYARAKGYDVEGPFLLAMTGWILAWLTAAPHLAAKRVVTDFERFRSLKWLTTPSWLPWASQQPTVDP